MAARETILGLSPDALTAIATLAIAVATMVSVWVSVQLGRAQDRLMELQTRMAEMQERANWLNGALASHSQMQLRLKAEEMGKPVIWWDPLYDGPQKKRPTGPAVHGESAIVQTVYAYVPEEDRRGAKID